ncbi:MAG: ATP-binding protein [Minisyncoccia bacterium]
MQFNFDYFSISVLIGCFASLISGFVVYLHNHKTTESIAWFFFNASAALWSFGYFILINAPNKDVAFYASWILHIAAIMVPLFCLVSVVSITNTYKVHRYGVVAASIISLFLIISTPTKLFVIDYIPKGTFNYMVEVGPLYGIFTFYFFALVVYVLTILIRKYNETSNPIEIIRYKYIIIFTTAGSIGGGSVFFLNYNIPIEPYPLILFSLFPIISIYAIFRFKLFDVKVITTEFIVFSLWIFLFIRTLISSSTEERVINGGLFFIILIAGMLLIRSVIKEVHLREELDESNKKLKASNEGQVSLMHFMNHQVKGRFGNSKNIFAELLTDDYGVMPKDAIPLLQKGLDETNMGIDYVQNVLRGASAENGQIPYEMKPVDFKQILETAFAKEKDRAESKGLKFTLSISDGEYSMQGDARQLSEAVRNLIDNSLTYTPEGNVEVALSGDKYAIKLNIKDTGVGILEEDKPKLFKSGVRGTDSLRFNVNSTGYGLAFVKGVVDAHKGRVWAESDGRWKGSTFNLELPKG